MKCQRCKKTMVPADPQMRYSANLCHGCVGEIGLYSNEELAALMRQLDDESEWMTVNEFWWPPYVIRKLILTAILGAK